MTPHCEFDMFMLQGLEKDNYILRKNSKNASPLNTLYLVESEAVHAEALILLYPNLEFFNSKIMHFIHTQLIKWKKAEIPKFPT